MLEQILAANIQNDAQPLTTVISLLTTLKSGWDEAIGTQSKRVTHGGAK
jgi:flagellin-specific chaperone FliS